MEKIIYTQLLSEGSIAYWPVPALQVGINLFRVSGLDGKYISIAIQQKVE